jgi:hypothetical protein
MPASRRTAARMEGRECQDRANLVVFSVFRAFRGQIFPDLGSTIRGSLPDWAFHSLGYACLLIRGESGGLSLRSRNGATAESQSNSEAAVASLPHRNLKKSSQNCI